MEIEERELHYPGDAPLRAWRLFRVRSDEDGLVLSAPMFHDPDHPLWPERMHEASCTEDHSAPAPGCRCGIYGAVQGTLDSPPGYLRDTAYEQDPWVYAEIGCSGRVFVDMRGVRAERAGLLRLAAEGDRLNETERDQLAARYGVPVVDADEVPEWVIHNVREGGPPPGDHPLALDLDALELSS